MPVVDSEFYLRALKDLKAIYEKKPSEKTLRQILFYSEKLDWPENSLVYLNSYLEKHGLDKKIVSMFLQYYLSNEKHSDLVNLLDRWEFYHGLDEELAQYRIRSSIQGADKQTAVNLIQSYTDDFQSAESYEFAVRQSMAIGDSLGEMRYLQLLVELDPVNRLAQRHYVPYLLNSGHYMEAYGFLQNAIDEAPEDFDLQLSYARALQGLDSTNKAVSILRGFNEPEAYRYLAKWYQRKYYYDSAVYFANALLVEDSSRNTLLLKGDILEERGWLNSSYAVFSTLVKRDTTDSIAAARADIVARKIAYLRRLREEREAIPIPDLEPKRLEE